MVRNHYLRAVWQSHLKHLDGYGTMPRYHKGQFIAVIGLSRSIPVKSIKLVCIKEHGNFPEMLACLETEMQLLISVVMTP